MFVHSFECCTYIVQVVEYEWENKWISSHRLLFRWLCEEFWQCCFSFEQCMLAIEITIVGYVTFLHTMCPQVTACFSSYDSSGANAIADVLSVFWLSPVNKHTLQLPNVCIVNRIKPRLFDRSIIPVKWRGGYSNGASKRTLREYLQMKWMEINGQF